MIGARETVRVRYGKGQPEVEATPNEASTRPVRERTAGTRLAEARKQDRERRQSSVRRRRIAIAVLVAIAIVLAFAGLLRLRHSQAFAITQVRVVGVHQVPAAEIRRLAAVPSGTTLFEADPSDIVRRVETNTWVASARVERRFPHVIVVTVVERTPEAWVGTGKSASRSRVSGQWLVSTDAVWLRPRARSETSTAPVITDVEGLSPKAGETVAAPEVVNALAVLRGLSPGLRDTIRSVSAPSVDKTALITRDGVQIYIGSASDIAKKDAVVRAILAQHKGKLVYINVRTPDRPTWRGLESSK